MRRVGGVGERGLERSAIEDLRRELRSGRSRYRDTRSLKVATLVARRFHSSSEIAALRARIAFDHYLAKALRRASEVRRGRASRQYSLPVGTIERLCKRALSLDPRCGPAWEDLAGLYDIASRYPLAEAAARKAVRYARTAKDRTDSLALLAHVMAERGQVARAKSLVRRSGLIPARTAFVRMVLAELFDPV